MILIIGDKGSMGQRYRSIMRYLGRDFMGVDKGASPDHVDSMAERSSGIIIATPTDTHTHFLRRYMGLKKPILCEKPVTKNIDELHSVMSDFDKAGTPLRMMYQYKLLAHTSAIGRTHYDYFRHGNDGLIWDCLQVIGLARGGEVRLSEQSPVWSCMINGRALRIQHMDAAYIAYVQTWFQTPRQSPEEIIRVHEKTALAVEKHKAQKEAGLVLRQT